MKNVLEDLRLETASTQKRIQINEIIDYISENRDSLLNSGQSLVYELTVTVNDWQREQDPFQNDVP